MKKKVNPITKFFVKLLGNEKYQGITIPIFAIVLSLIVGAIVIAVLGKDPLSAYLNILQGKWQPTPVFLPGESQGLGSLVGCRLWDCTESDMTEAI